MNTTLRKKARSNARWRAIGAMMLGVLFIGAGSVKLAGIYEFRVTVDAILAQSLGSSGLQLSQLRDGITALVPSIEIMVGLALTCFATRPRIPAILATGLLAGFSAVLVLLLTMDQPPSCSCLGSWKVFQTDGRTGALIGLFRNAGLLIISTWLIFDIPRRPALSPHPQSGFALVEVLVVLVVLAVLIAILLPALGQARKAGRRTERLAAMRQSLAATVQYADAHAGYLPFLAEPGNPEAGTLPEEDWGTFGAPSYFRGQSQLWPTALLRHGIDLTHLPYNSRPSTGPARISTYFRMTHAAVARPPYWEDVDPPDGRSLFDGVRVSEVLFPSAKGCLAFVGWTPEEAATVTAWEVGMFDGAAALRSMIDPPVQIDGPYRPFGAVDWRVFTTPEGVRGRDY